MIHLIPPGEEHLHIKSPDCECDPEFNVDEESGEMVYTHLPLDADIEMFPELLINNPIRKFRFDFIPKLFTH